MRKIMILMMAFLLPFTALEMRADEPKVENKIPLTIDRKGILSRDASYRVVAAYYPEFTSVLTVVIGNLGDVEVIVTNTSTGEFWSDTFDSTTERQSFLQISGSQGYYEIEYITESGDVYSGQFLIE